MHLKVMNTDMKEIAYARKLGHVENSVRLNALMKLRKFIYFKSSSEAFTLDDLMNIWKGLYYCMYMSDKPLVQEKLADDIASLIPEFQNSSQKFIFFEAAFATFVREWNGIDKFRMDKFMMLFTRFLRQSFIYLKQNEWNLDEVGRFAKLLETTIICPSDCTNSKPLGLKMHLTDILLDELAKVGQRSLPNDVTITFLYPFFKVLVVCKQGIFIKYVESKIFGALVRQSDLGIKHQDDLTLGELEVIKDEEDIKEDEEMLEDGPLDPRAGGVDVFIPQITPKYVQIADIFIALGGMPEVNQKKRNLLYKHSNIFLDLEMGVYPFKDPELKMEFDIPRERQKLVKKGIENIKEFEHQMEIGTEAAEVTSCSKKLKLGDYGTNIKKNRNQWVRLKKKSKEERRKEITKEKLNSEFAVNKMFVKLAERKKIPNSTYVTSAPLKKIKIKKPQNNSNINIDLSAGKAGDYNSLAKFDHSKYKDHAVSIATNPVVTSLPLEKKPLIDKKRKLKSKISVENSNENLRKKDSKKRTKKILKDNIENLRCNDLPKKKKQKTSAMDVSSEEFKVNTSEKKSKNDETELTENMQDTHNDNLLTVMHLKDDEKLVNISTNISLKTIPTQKKKNEKKIVIKKKILKNSSNQILKEKTSNESKVLKLINDEGKPVNIPSSPPKKANGKKFMIKKKILKNSSNQILKEKANNETKVFKLRKDEGKLSNDVWNESLKKKKLLKNLQDSICENSTASIPAVVNSIKSRPTGNLKKNKVNQKPQINMVIKTQKVNTQGKLLKINLRQNTEHDLQHYKKILNSSPGIPFSANKKPKTSVLKTTPSPNNARKLMKLKRLQEYARKL